MRLVLANAKPGVSTPPRPGNLNIGKSGIKPRANLIKYLRVLQFLQALIIHIDLSCSSSDIFMRQTVIHFGLELGQTIIRLKQSFRESMS